VAATTRGSVDEIKGRRKRRFVAIWIIAAVFLVGNALDLLGVINWGPGQSNPDSRVTVLLSAALFWVAVAMVILCFRDLVSIFKHHSRPPTLEDLKNAKAEAGEVDDTGSFWNEATEWIQKHQAIVGLIGFVVGAIGAHFFWGVGGY
jgi:hypothetical protein